MTWRKREIMEMARKAGFMVHKDSLYTNHHYGDCRIELEAFEALVRADERNRTWTQDRWTEYERSIAAAEREACAKVCEPQEEHDDQLTAWKISEAIKARGQA